MSEISYEFAVSTDGEMDASGDCPTKEIAISEAERYAGSVYDGRVVIEVSLVVRTKVYEREFEV